MKNRGEQLTDLGEQRRKALKLSLRAAGAGLAHYFLRRNKALFEDSKSSPAEIENQDLITFTNKIKDLLPDEWRYIIDEMKLVYSPELEVGYKVDRENQKVIVNPKAGNEDITIQALLQGVFTTVVLYDIYRGNTVFSEETKINKATVDAAKMAELVMLAYNSKKTPAPASFPDGSEQDMRDAFNSFSSILGLEKAQRYIGELFGELKYNSFYKELLEENH